MTFENALKFILKEIKDIDNGIKIKGVFYNNKYWYSGSVLSGDSETGNIKIVEDTPKLGKEIMSLIEVKDIMLSYFNHEIIIFTEDLRDFYKREVENIVIRLIKKYKNKFNKKIKIKIKEVIIFNELDLYLRILVGEKLITYRYFFSKKGYSLFRFEEVFNIRANEGLRSELKSIFNDSELKKHLDEITDYVPEEEFDYEF